MGLVKCQEKKLIIWIMWILANHSFFLGKKKKELWVFISISVKPTDYNSKNETLLINLIALGC